MISQIMGRAGRIRYTYKFMSWLMVLGIQTLFPDPPERNDPITITRSELYARALATGRNGDDTYRGGVRSFTGFGLVWYLVYYVGYRMYI
jgi:hypothetical protein